MEGGEIKGRMVAAGQEKEMWRSGSKKVWLFSMPEKKKLGLPFLLLLSSSSFNSRNLKAEGTPGQLCVSLF